ncbi:MAG: Ger(x)C family spore germination C-terminal domain-containing protein [Christensenellaceae bacterium]
MFSASETALFYDGIYAGKLDQDETFAFSIVKNKLRLASYTPKSDGIPYTLIVKHNLPSLKFSVDDNSMARLKIKLKVTAGLQDTSYGQSIDELANAGKVPPKVFEAAKKDLEKKISQVFEKSRKSRCDVFNVLDRLQKFESDYFPPSARISSTASSSAWTSLSKASADAFRFSLHTAVKYFLQISQKIFQNPLDKSEICAII